jgi:hypothetical protein
MSVLPGRRTIQYGETGFAESDVSDFCAPGEVTEYATFKKQTTRRRDGRVVEGARLESVFRGNSNVGSNPTLSAIRL